MGFLSWSWFFCLLAGCSADLISSTFQREEFPSGAFNISRIVEVFSLIFSRLLVILIAGNVQFSVHNFSIKFFFVNFTFEMCYKSLELLRLFWGKIYIFSSFLFLNSLFPPVTLHIPNLNWNILFIKGTTLIMCASRVVGDEAFKFDQVDGCFYGTVNHEYTGPQEPTLQIFESKRNQS